MLMLVCAVLAALVGALTGLALSPLVESMLNRWRFRLRVAGLRRRGSARRSATTIRRTTPHRHDALVQRWLPGGDAVAARLLVAGGRWSLGGLVAVGLGVGVAVAVVGWAFGLSWPLAVLLVPAVALGFVRLASRAVAARAQAAFGRGFADAVAVMIRSLRAGLPVAAAVAEVARSGAGPVPRAFGAVVEDMRLGQPLEVALWAAARRIGVAEFDFLVVVVALQRETGGNLAETLDGLDETLRMRRQLALKVRALAAEARASAMIIASLPFAMAALLWVSSPDYLVPLFTTSMGRAMLGAGLASMAVGALVIREMLAIKA
jgi:tight adherence protein B